MSGTNRNRSIYDGFMDGVSKAELARRFGLSHIRIHQIILDQQRCIAFHQEQSELIDKNIARYGTWEQKVSTLMPHIEAIRAIAESEQGAKKL